MVVRNITIIPEKEYDTVQNEYGEIINSFEISNSDDAKADVWNKYNTEQVPNKKRGKYQDSFLTDDDRKMSVTKKISRNLKEKCLEPQTEK